jgi:cytidylate kinase
MARGIEQIVTERVLKWPVERRSTTPPPSSSVRTAIVAQRPMITISRECGSLGGELGRLVADKLRFTFYSQELVHEIATTAKVRNESVQSLDEQPRSGLEVIVREIIDGEAFGASDYLHFLGVVLRALGRSGRGVIVGRGSHLILESALTLRVRVYAALPQRIDNTAARFGISREQSAIDVRRVDRERAAFYRQRFGVEWDEPCLYDLSINTTTVPLVQCADLVAAAYRARFGEPD